MIPSRHRPKLLNRVGKVVTNFIGYISKYLQQKSIALKHAFVILLLLFTF